MKFHKPALLKKMKEYKSKWKVTFLYFLLVTFCLVSFGFLRKSNDTTVMIYVLVVISLIALFLLLRINTYKINFTGNSISIYNLEYGVVAEMC